MDMDLYLHHYREFHAEFCPGAGTAEKADKVYEEAHEFIDAYFDDDENAQINESLDLMNTAIAFLVEAGIKDPLHAGYLKLQRTAEKYRRQNGTTGTPL